MQHNGLSLTVIVEVGRFKVHHEGVMLGYFSLNKVGIHTGTLAKHFGIARSVCGAGGGA